jgi:hypothetical protein
LNQETGVVDYDALATTAEECKEPQKDLPKSMINSLLICTVLYILIALVLTGMVSYTELAVGDPLAFVFEKVNLGWMSGIVAVSAVIAMASVLLVFQNGQPRIWMSMSRDGLLPKRFSNIHPKFKTPAFSTIVTGLFVAVPALFLNLKVIYSHRIHNPMKKFLLLFLFLIPFVSTAQQWKKTRKEILFGAGAANLLGDLGGADQIGTHLMKDLEISLTCPNGTVVSLMNAYNQFGEMIPGGCGNGIGTFLGNDTNLDGGAPGSPVWTYCFSPTMATFGSICTENAAGNWITNSYGFPSMNPNGVYLPDGNFNDFIG